MSNYVLSQHNTFEVAERGCSPSDVDGTLTSGGHPAWWFGKI